MKYLAIFLATVVASGLGAESAQKLTRADLNRLSFDQNLGAQVPLDLSFRDDQSQTVHLGGYFGADPVILILGYYQCPMLCNLVLNGAVEGLEQILPSAHRGYQLIFVSIDPGESPSLALAKKESYLKRLGRPDAKDRWHFLTGSEDSARRLASVVGFHYRYDPARAQYAHPSGLVVLTPGGKVSRYFFGVSYPARDLNDALETASAHRTGSPIHRFLLLCSQFVPLTGKYSGLIMTTVRSLGVATLFVLGGIMVLGCRRRSRERAPLAREGDQP